MSGELKPCPFCGGTTLGFDSHRGQAWVECKTCWNRGPLAGWNIDDDGDADAVEKWNARADNWISVEDRLPEQWKEVLIARAQIFDGKLSYCYAIAYHDGHHFGDHNRYFLDASHWKELTPPHPNTAAVTVQD